MNSFSNSKDSILKNDNNESYRRQYISAIIACMPMFTTGNGISWIGPVLLKFKYDNIYNLTNLDINSLTIMFPIGIAIGAILGVILSNFFGRRICLMIVTIPFIISTALFLFGERTVLFLDSSRFINGIGAGISFAVTPAYLTEISSPKIRGFIVTIMTVFLSFGCLFSYIIIPLTTLEVTSIIEVIPSIILLLFSFTLPETPYYFLSIGCEKKAKQSFILLRGCQKETIQEIENEILKIKNHIESENIDKLIDILKLKDTQKSFLIIFLIFFCQILTGFSSLTTFSQDLFDEANFKIITPELQGIITNSTYFIFSFLFSSLPDKFGRRRMLIFSTFSVSFSLFFLGLLFFLKDLGVPKNILDSINWLPFVSAVLCQILLCFGLTNIPYIYTGELFSTRMRTYAGSASNIFSALVCSIVLQFHIWIKGYGSFCPWWGYAFISLFNTWLLYLFVPETKGKKLECDD